MKWLLWLAAALPLTAHVVSLSTGNLQITGSNAKLTLRVPIYELTEGEKMLDGAYLIAGAAQQSRTCRNEGEETVCEYVYREVPERVRVICRFTEVLVANHVHVLTAHRDGQVARAVFSGAQTEMDLRFDGDEGAGAGTFLSGILQAAAGWPRLLLFAAIALAVRTRREGVALALALTAGQALSGILLPRVGFIPSPRFVEAAAAIAVGYLAFEILVLPHAQSRWIVAGALGILLGLGIPPGVGPAYYAGLLGTQLAAALLLSLPVLGAWGAARPSAALLLLLAGFWLAKQLIA